MKQRLDWPIVRALGKAMPLSPLIMYLVLILIFIAVPLAASRTRGNLLFTAILGGGMVLTGLSSTLFEQVIPYSILFGSVFFCLLGLAGWPRIATSAY